MKKKIYNQYKQVVLQQFLQSNDCILFFNTFHWDIIIKNELLAFVKLLNGDLLYCSNKQLKCFNGSFLLLKIEKNSIFKLWKQFPSLKNAFIGIQIGTSIYSTIYLNKYLLSYQKTNEFYLISQLSKFRNQFYFCLNANSTFFLQQLKIKQITLIDILKVKSS